MNTQRGGAVSAAGLIAGLALAAQPMSSRAQPPVTPLSVALVSIVERPGDKRDTTEVLPFARNPLPRTFPSVGAGISYGPYLADFTSVERAFRAVEDYYRAAGYFLPEAAPVDLGPMTMPSLRVRLTPWLDAAFQAGRTGATVDQLTLLGGLVSGLYTPRSADYVSLFAGLGGGAYGFSFERGYGARVSPIDPGGGYYVLDKLTLKGGGRYWTAAGGLTIRSGHYIAFEAFGQYFGTGDVSTTTQAGEISLNLSGAMIGVSFNVFF